MPNFIGINFSHLQYRVVGIMGIGAPFLIADPKLHHYGAFDLNVNSWIKLELLNMRKLRGFMIAISAPDKAPYRPPSNRGILVFVVVSLVIHTLVVVIVSRGGVTTPAVAPNKAAPIKARIIYPPLPVQVEETTPDLTDNQPIEKIEVALESELEQTVETPLEPLPDATQQDTPPFSSTEELSTEPANQVESESQGSFGSSSMSLTERYFNRLHQQHIQSQGEIASQEYRRSITSPDLDLPTMAEIAEEPGPKTQTVACDDTAANVLRIISQLAGGTLRCRDKPDIDEFIQKRLDKEQ
ncbi:hypothetical protein QTP81_11555 [Alteromonas sp. ASW11-36]|uniref:Uncharacterized protein n=1 Tax=Alteromonas arenosi TaxID=3055817 RepID=A0ABT7SYH0_9ALTE|nr:hypothetical protein [Alteromonas sp. ASW11-36]MDM7861230.1 hypothetical protein [Alteromonas sp. ASW11-36]